MPVYGVPRDPPPFGLLFESIVLDDLAYMMGSFDAYVDTSRVYDNPWICTLVGAYRKLLVILSFFRN